MLENWRRFMFQGASDLEQPSRCRAAIPAAMSMGRERLDFDRWSSRMQPEGESFASQSKPTKLKESKMAFFRFFFYFLLVFGIGTFQWLMAEKSRKNLPLQIFASGLHRPGSDPLARLSRPSCFACLAPLIRPFTNAITVFSF
jgi:hypothetical protein